MKNYVSFFDTLKYRINELILVLKNWFKVENSKQILELRKSLLLSESANIEKSKYFASMSHEIRNSINGLLGMAQLLNGSHLNEEQQVHLNILLTSGKNLKKLVDGILDLSKIEAGKLEVDIHDFDLPAVVENSLMLYKPLAQAKGLQLEINLADDLPNIVKGDSTLLLQIFSNLVSNAIKFSDHGVIYVSVKSELVACGNCMLQCAVQDSGIGISSDHLNRLFKLYSQADSSMARRYGGTGLGLAICARLCELMGGSIAVESDEGIGSIFRFSVRLKVSNAQLERDKKLSLSPHDVDTNLRVLLVDDNEINRILVSTLLTRMGIRPDHACDGVEVLTRFDDGYIYDVVLMDVQMPTMDGIQATIAIRKMQLLLQPYIVAMTANAYAGDRQRCFEAGMDDFLSKPFTITELQNKLPVLHNIK